MGPSSTNPPRPLPAKKEMWLRSLPRKFLRLPENSEALEATTVTKTSATGPHLYDARDAWCYGYACVMRLFFEFFDR